MDCVSWCGHAFISNINLKGNKTKHDGGIANGENCSVTWTTPDSPVRPDEQACSHQPWKTNAVRATGIWQQKPHATCGCMQWCHIQSMSTRDSFIPRPLQHDLKGTISWRQGQVLKDLQENCPLQLRSDLSQSRGCVPIDGAHQWWQSCSTTKAQCGHNCPYHSWGAFLKNGCDRWWPNNDTGAIGHICWEWWGLHLYPQFHPICAQ